ncbi:peroxisomal membrane protein PMP22 [Coccinella septempunctata]|uniref:peroxisomal membrane protein PMP22 n=1 Tax=Coccinella septempunctata TaxID=41139 RepID=UPI001D05D067|nr:peroxisomal membrane protein PMP22 [Coccinella septempunctata]
MVLSKPLMKVLQIYFSELYTNPIRTNAITGALIAAGGNYASQFLAGKKVINNQTILAYGAFGLLFGGTIPHFFYLGLDHMVSDEAAMATIKRFLIERIIYTPLFQAFFLYMLARFEGKDHQTAMRQIQSLYWTVLTTSWKYITIIELMNQMVVPPMLRVLVSNLIAFFWTIFISNKRRQEELRANRKIKK